MTIQKRSFLMGSLLVLALVLYGAAKYYSPALVRYVVEQSLLQKAPAGIHISSLRKRFQAVLSAAPDKKSQMERLLQISEYLEKVQQLNLEQLNRLLAVDGSGNQGSAGFQRGLPETVNGAAGENPAL